MSPNRELAKAHALWRLLLCVAVALRRVVCCGVRECLWRCAVFLGCVCVFFCWWCWWFLWRDGCGVVFHGILQNAGCSNIGSMKTVVGEGCHLTTLNARVMKIVCDWQRRQKKSAEPLTAQKSHDEPVRATAKPPRATSQTKASHHPRIVIGQGLDTESPEDGERWSQPQCCLRYCVTPIYSVGTSVPVTFEARHMSRMMQIGRFSVRRPINIASLAILSLRSFSGFVRSAVCACWVEEHTSCSEVLFQQHLFFGWEDRRNWCGWKDPSILKARRIGPHNSQQSEPSIGP